MARVSASSSYLAAISTICIFLFLFEPASSDDKQALLAFASQVPHSHRLQWGDVNGNDSFCSWIGVYCDSTRTAVRALRLPGIGIAGVIPDKTIGNLSELRVLSLRSNRLSGNIPADFEKLHLLRALYMQDNDFSGYFPPAMLGLNRLTRLNLSYNKFRGDIPPGLSRLDRLTRLDLSWNRFTGGVPSAVNNLTGLRELLLQNNGFTGRLPSIQLTRLLHFNVSNNNLKGSIPPTLARFGGSSFRGNLDLCGPPLEKKCEAFIHTPSPPSPANATPKSSGSKISKAAIIAISVGSVLAFIVFLILLIVCLRKRRDDSTTRKPTGVPSLEASSSTTTAIPSEAEKSKLVFFHGGGRYTFGLEDLLRASAEVLGKGSVGTSYKAVLEDGTMVVVKRLKDVAVTQEEFERTMEIVGHIDHENVISPRAYYYSRDEKLLVSDYIPTGTLSALLHGIRGSGKPALDWGSRLRIAISTARGLLHLHRSFTLVHGNVKSSNILLLQDHTAAVSDFGLHPLFGTSPPPPNRLSGYRSPEYIETRIPTMESDVYGFGMVLLELVTGRAANQMAGGEDGIDLPRWVRSVGREEWRAEVLDSEVIRVENGVEEEMVKSLQIAMACVATVPAQRPEMGAVLGMLEGVRLGGDALVVPP